MSADNIIRLVNPTLPVSAVNEPVTHMLIDTHGKSLPFPVSARVMRRFGTNVQTVPPRFDPEAPTNPPQNI